MGVHSYGYLFKFTKYFKIIVKDPKHLSGFVSIIGKPNAGKSTLLNQLLGRKLSITTAKAQTTRHRIFGIDSTDEYQIVYSDTPGLIRPKYRLHERMNNFIDQSMKDADLIILLIAADETFPEDDLIDKISTSKIPVILALNKADIVEQDALFQRMGALAEKINFLEAIPISALHGTQVDLLKSIILANLPEGPAYFPKDQISDRPERFFASEIIREKIFIQLREELPYSTEVEIDEFHETEELVTIAATIHVERQNHKGMVIGKQGKTLKSIGTAARIDIEAFLRQKVHLSIYVKVSNNWKNSISALRGFGYQN